MSMNMITFFQLIGLLVSYLILTVFLPEFVLGKTLALQNRYEKFLYYAVIGNFYVINLVYVLELLHISYPVTLILFTLLPAFAIKIRLEHIPFFELVKMGWETFRKLVTGELGLKTYLADGKPARRERRKKLREHLFRVYIKGLPEFIPVALFIGLLVYQYGYNLFESYGYKASDLVVHNYWINALDENDIFVSGVYPYGFHNMLYYIHSVFGFDTYVLLRIESFVQVLWIFIVLLCFLKLLCKSKYVPFLAAFLSVGVNFFRTSTYTRYYATLPQEYGMIFILPAIYCGFLYFKTQKQVLAGDETDDRCKIYLIGFAMSFSLTLTVHFYGTMIAGFFSVAMAVGFLLQLVKKPYFRRVMLTCLISVVIAILPMGIAFATGTPLQGSLDWGMSVITGKSFGSVSVEEEQVYYENEYVDVEDSTAEQDAEEILEEEITETVTPSIKERLKGALSYMESSLDEFVFNEDFAWLSKLLLVLIPALALLGLLLLVLPRAERFYGSVMISTAVYMCLMVLLLNAGNFGLPSLMDQARGSIYFAYSVPILFAFFVDGILYLPSLFILKQYFYQPLSLAALAAGVFFTGVFGWDRKPYPMGSMCMNESMICLTNIIREEQDDTWTIISANDEGRMVYGHGYHYETYVFLREMQGLPEVATMRIPTQTVYFFVEKRPVDYGVGYDGSGQLISDEGASSFFPRSSGLGVYQGMYRWIIMSKMYAWAETFKALYPNEMKVFYETENFICYRCEQNPYRLFNFSIDYGYNTAGYSKS